MRLNKIKKEQSKFSSVKVTRSIFTDYRWWRYQDTEPEGGYVEVPEVEHSKVYPVRKKATKRKTNSGNLSRTKLRRRLSDAGYRGSDLSQLISEITKRDGAKIGDSYSGIFVLGWPEPVLKQKIGRALFNRITYKVPRILMVLDEMRYYMSAQMKLFTSESMLLGRKYSVSPHLLTQSATDFTQA
jgi:hypothetical protein